ncbi:small acid-soluble spore protein O [Virgibacillus halodenitrificans]|jgi:small acid-soluble spore protein O (minor)|uniref:Small acid-soluble spore protein O n=1 Tax=Virgibacillus halodenitrificans TaxID=1482 RepID=A0AAC9NKU8_VIRHA|nr:small acid-soluble spore protein O [Virgibacillus halodenitrificans]APC47951.1 small acid-soluble spore protein O [Virgibacillus halodenitrificans]MBD1224541.1 small acid-soluble spore protein O [Virgibacillus halodenitrificans]MCJ0933233.1 small acid-soluble spore protein O [Virgibacillus halodenitrificans]MEC2160833.1 small acid-soluble spore protein O [Virgibacillus halodenitrificans]MYL45133.1 small acid-soluble spore protein O [Virgibacillus halodenitrificans]
MSKNKKKLTSTPYSSDQPIAKRLTKKMDHEFANEPLTEMERQHNKKTKKRQ